MDVGAEGDKPDRKIILRNWTWTHNHHTNNTIFAGYFGAESIPEDSRVLESVGLLADANAESHYVRDYLSDALERQVTPQQARNIVQRVLENDSVEEQLTSMLDTLDKHEDHDVLVLRDQNDVTCGVVIQTAVQKIAFKKWGETLCMDWTYGTNNLGFHLGVEDIGECFPEATVLLCQFHAMKTWKKIVKTRKYGLNGIQQDEVENAIMKMMYSTTSAAFIRVRDDFENFCNGLCPDICNKPCAEIFMYFQENRENCSDMWSNFGRGNYFTAGNTTTNRIESNWNQLKRLLGKKTRVDRTVAAYCRTK
ncbi:Kinesin-II 85 kDa subunit [Phytophthora nicotianae]|uniref:Kinesin-II 85 kDa subunit n=1 Tax=Phytophthora nicotianae TaxID=4792 RepID=A0A0W8DKY5_PHYNI|nr:Kinesin-II 85 kDa subunit [Phytophthora nicotianae]